MIGKMIQFMRKTKGVCQNELAQELSVKQGTFSGYETDYSEPNFRAVQKIAEACGFQLRFADLKSNDEFILNEKGEISKVKEEKKVNQVPKVH